MPFDSRSEKNIATLLPKAQTQARKFLQKVLDAGMDVRIISGTRTFQEQDELFALGRTKPPIGKSHIVTNARGGFSNHNFGIAWDIGLFKDGVYLEESPLYKKAGKIGRDLGLEWGGDWKSFPDQPHFQCRTGLTLAQMRALVNAGKGDTIPVLPLPSGDDDETPPKPPPAPTETPVKIDVYLGSDLLENVPAYLVESRVYVAVRAFVEQLGGGVVSAGGDPFSATIALHGQQIKIKGMLRGNMGYVKFADLNVLLGFTFIFDGPKKRLTLLV